MCSPGPKGSIVRVNMTAADLESLEAKGWKVMVGWLLSPTSVQAVEIVPAIGVQGPTGPSAPDEGDIGYNRPPA